MAEDGKKKLGRYEIVSRIGEGGMAVVYKAFDPVLGRNLALKVAKKSIKPESTDKREINSHLAEARLAAQFIHPNIAVIYDAGCAEGHFYLALEYIEGKGLDIYARKPGLLSRIRVLEIIFTTCHALQYIHDKGYLHLDIKPANIMLTQMGEVKLMDFGIARLFEQEKRQDSVIAGSPYYMAPEQADPSTVPDFRTDIYSLGVVLYELLTGARPFQGENACQILYRAAHADPRPIEENTPDIPPHLAQIVCRAMNREKKSRFNSAKDFANALLPIIKGNDTIAIDKENDRKISRMKRLSFFKHFAPGNLAEAIRISAWNSCRRHTMIAEEQGNNNTIYILVRGKASLLLRNEVTHLKKGDCFGESAILYNLPRHWKAKAETDCLIMEINASILNQASKSLQVLFLKEFYKVKTLQLVETNLKLIQSKTDGLAKSL